MGALSLSATENAGFNNFAVHNCDVAGMSHHIQVVVSLCASSICPNINANGRALTVQWSFLQSASGRMEQHHGN